jgi:hypothetical protein
MDHNQVRITTGSRDAVGLPFRLLYVTAWQSAPTGILILLARPSSRKVGFPDAPDHDSILFAQKVQST